MIMNISPIMEIIIGIVSSPTIILNPVAMISINPKTAKGRERREMMFFVIYFTLTINQLCFKDIK